MKRSIFAADKRSALRKLCSDLREKYPDADISLNADHSCIDAVIGGTFYQIYPTKLDSEYRHRDTYEYVGPGKGDYKKVGHNWKRAQWDASPSKVKQVAKTYPDLTFLNSNDVPVQSSQRIIASGRYSEMNESELYAVDMAIGLVLDGQDIEDAVSQAVSDVWAANETADEADPYYEEPIDQEKVLRAVQKRFGCLPVLASSQTYGSDFYVREIEEYLGETIQAQPSSSSEYAPYVYTRMFPDEESAWNYRATVRRAAGRLRWYVDPYVKITKAGRGWYKATVEIPRFYTLDDMEQDRFWETSNS